MINVDVLKYYGGVSDLEKIDEYLSSIIANKEQRRLKLSELFSQAFEFISHPVFWQAIKDLSDYIFKTEQEIVSCEEAIEILDDSVMRSSRFFAFNALMVN